MNEFKCYSHNLKNFLTNKGFMVIKKRPNLKDPFHYVYIFWDSPKLRMAQTEFTNIQKMKKDNNNG